MPHYLLLLRDKIKQSYWTFPLLIAVAFAWGLRGAYGYTEKAVLKQGSWRIDVEGDTAYLLHAVNDHPTALSTLQWWYNPWYRDVPYFRPLSVTLFWVEHRIFGTDGLLGFQGVHWFMHGLFLVLLWGFLARIAGKARAGVAVACFAAGWNDILNLPTGADAFNCWKDTVDVWAAMAMTGTAWMYLRYLRSGGKRWWVAALALWVVNLSIKESGFITPFILALVLWFSGEWRVRWKSVVPFFMLAPCAWLYRTWAVGGYGNRTGSGDAWLVRFALDGLGIPPRLVNGDLVALIPLVFLAPQIYALWRWRGRTTRVAGQATAAAILAGALLAGVCLTITLYQTGMTLNDTLSRFMLMGPWLDSMTACLFLALYAQILKHRDPAQIFGLVWVWINFSPLIIQPPTSPHVFYPIAPGWSLVLACAVWGAAREIRAAAGRRRAPAPAGRAELPVVPPA